MTDGAKGTIWASGLHKPYLNGKPATLYVPPETIKDSFKLFQDEITQNGGIKLGIDHLPDELINAYPILKKLNLTDVGKATEIRTDGTRIYATKSEHTNPLIAELYSRGDLPAFSIKANAKTVKCPTGKADYVLEKLNNIERIDYVDEGACTACKVGNVPDDMILTAKLSMEEETMTEEERNDLEDSQEEESQESTEEENTEEQQEEEEQASEPEALTVDSLKGMLGDFKEEVTTLVSDLVKGETQKVEAKLATMKEDTEDMKLEAKKAVVGSKIDAKIKEGFITPAMRDGLLEAGLAVKEEEKFDTMLAGFNKKLWEGGQMSEEPTTDEPLSMEDFRKARKMGRF